MTSAYKESRVTCVTFDPFLRDEVFIANNRGTVVYKMKNPSNSKKKLFFGCIGRLLSIEWQINVDTKL